MSVEPGRRESLALALQTSAAMVAFAANSLLCRLALQARSIDPASFASIRIVSGALLLAWLVRRRPRDAASTDWVAALALVAYLLPFTLAYLTLDAGTGALLLFGAVQLTMLAVGLYGGERCTALGWCGIAAAVGGFVYLLAPGHGAPPLGGAAAMALAGIAWGVYSLRGRGSLDPLASTARNFLLAVPWVLAVNVAAAGRVHVSAAGVALALGSGAVASALGYVAWYAALRRLSALAAGTVQLSVPAIAAFGGIALLGEGASVRLLVSSAAILGGIALVARQRRAPRAA